MTDLISEHPHHESFSPGPRSKCASPSLWREAWPYDSVSTMNCLGSELWEAVNSQCLPLHFSLLHWSNRRSTFWQEISVMSHLTENCWPRMSIAQTSNSLHLSSWKWRVGFLLVYPQRDHQFARPSSTLDCKVLESKSCAHRVSYKEEGKCSEKLAEWHNSLGGTNGHLSLVSFYQL